ncbi:MAG: HAD-IIIA family hydrolase [Candidatus Omnitrophica bacterium]|nr:HAD-IIIA family hydrolase [Candidatus Omnitrophota bacterium]
MTMINEKAKKIKLLVMDVDGVLTDGRIIYTNSGDELKFFDVTDGMGLSLFKRAGLKTAILTAKKSQIVAKRAKTLNIDKSYQNAVRKADAYGEILSDFKVIPEEVCFIGDDLVDLPVLRKVGLAVAVSNAVPEVLEAAHYVTSKGGGRGAVREVIEIILKAQGKWQELMKRYV